MDDAVALVLGIVALVLLVIGLVLVWGIPEGHEGQG